MLQTHAPAGHIFASNAAAYFRMLDVCDASLAECEIVERADVARSVNVGRHLHVLISQKTAIFLQEKTTLKKGAIELAPYRVDAQRRGDRQLDVGLRVGRVDYMIDDDLLFCVVALLNRQTNAAVGLRSCGQNLCAINNPNALLEELLCRVLTKLPRHRFLEHVFLGDNLDDFELVDILEIAVQ